MCDGDDLKKPLYWLVEQDSRVATALGEGLDWDYLKEEGRKNQKNPGRAIGKAAASAAAWYLGGGGTSEAAGAAGNAASAAATAGMTAAEIAAQEAAMAAAMEGGFGFAQGAGAAAEQGVGMIPQGVNSLTQAPVSDLSTNAGLLDRTYAKGADAVRGLLSPSNGLTSGSSKGINLQQVQMGMKMMAPEQPQQMPQSRPMGSGQVEPLNNPYGQRAGPYGTPDGNSMGGLLETEEERKRRLRKMGYRG